MGDKQKRHHIHTFPGTGRLQSEDRLHQQGNRLPRQGMCASYPYHAAVLQDLAGLLHLFAAAYRNHLHCDKTQPAEIPRNERKAQEKVSRRIEQRQQQDYRHNQRGTFRTDHIHPRTVPADTSSRSKQPIHDRQSESGGI